MVIERQPKQTQEAREQRRKFFEQLHTVMGELRDNVQVFVEAACDESVRLASAEHLSCQSVSDAMHTARGAQDHEALGRLSSTLAEVVQSAPPAFRQKGKLIVDFLNHDRAHLDPKMLEMFATNHAFAQPPTEEPSHDAFTKTYNSPLPLSDEAVLRDHLQHADAILRQMNYPFDFVHALVAHELKQPLQGVERVDVASLCDAIARTLHMRFSADDYVLVDEDQRQPQRNEIIVHTDAIELETHKAMLWSVIYNLMKNAVHALTEDRKSVQESPLVQRVQHSILPERPKKLWLSVDAVPEHDVTLVTVADSGRGLDVHQILTILKKMAADGLVDTGSLTGATKRIIEQWPQHPFVIRNLRLGQALDLAALPRLSGRDVAELSGGKKSPSGLGLWGARLLTETMGGTILATNSGNPEWGAMFTVILPNHHFREKQRPGQVVPLVKRQLEHGQRPVHMPKSAAAA